MHSDLRVPTIAESHDLVDDMGIPPPLLAEYTPTPSGGVYEIIERRLDTRPLAGLVLDEMIGVFRGETTRPYFQLQRMGRACFTPLPDGSIVTAKGSLGRSPASESVKALEGKRWSSLYGDGAGSDRIELDGAVNFIAIHKPGSDGNPEVLQCFPEGYSRFADLLLEHRFSSMAYEPFGIRVPSSLALFRHNQPITWPDKKQAKQYFDERLHRQLLPGEQTIPLAGIDYTPPTGLDTGLLFRHFRTALRPQDYYDLAIANNWEALRAAHSPLQTHAESLAEHLAATAGKLISIGVIHGQLYYDHQNITAAGEICDLDGTIIAPSVNAPLAAKILSSLRRDEDRFGVEIVDEYLEGEQRMVPDSQAASKSLTEQAYYLWNCSLRLYDIAQRALQGIDSPGTVLEDGQTDVLRSNFTDAVARQLSARGRHIARIACRATADVDTDFRTRTEPPLLRYSLTNSLPTIYGWTSRRRPLNHFIHPTDAEDVEFIIRDYGRFTRSLLKSMEI